MRTGLFLLAGFLMLAGLLILARLFHENYRAAYGIAVGAFILIWLALAGFNLWVGVTRAGYSVGEEAPIFLLLFGVPAVVALLLKWKLLPG
ncbi:MAG: hypothetical protein ACREVL_02710 [Solimonas sp.]